MRINVQLIDGATGHHVHAEIFDRPVEDVLTVQDEIVEMLVAALAPALSQLEGLRALRKPTADLSAWEAFQRGMTFLNRQAPTDVEHAEDAFAHALAADPFFAPAHAGLSMARIGRGVYAVGATQLAPSAPEERKAAEVRAIELLASAQEPAREAIRLDPLDFSGHLALGGLQGFFRQGSQAIDSLTRAAELNPSSAMACWGLGGALLAPELDALGEGLALLERAVRLSPRDPLVHHFLGVLAGGYGLAGRFEDMLSAARRSVDRQPERGLSYVPYLVTALVRVGRLDEARALAARLRAENPDWNLDLARLLAHPELVALIADGLADAGWVIEGP